jgi:hypothetical protein
VARVAIVRQEGSNDDQKVFIEVGYAFDVTDTVLTDIHSVTDFITKAIDGLAGADVNAYSGIELIGGGFLDLTATHKPGDKISFQVAVGTVVVGQNEKDRPVPYGGGTVEVDTLGDFKQLPKQMNIGAGDQDVNIKVTVVRGAGATSPTNDFILGYWLKIRLLKV